MALLSLDSENASQAVPEMSKTLKEPPKPDVPEETRLLIDSVLTTQFGRTVADISQLAGNNSKVYGVTFSKCDAATSSTTGRRGTDPLPADTTRAVMRFTDPGAYLNEAVQVQNEVAALALAREALKGENIVPRVYAWEPAVVGGSDSKYTAGWMLEEYLPGAALSPDVFSKLDEPAKQTLVTDIARIFQRIQNHDLPPSVIGYGGLDFGADGQIITGPTPIHGATKSCATYYELYEEYLQTQLAFMDKCDVVEGWRYTLSGGEGTGGTTLRKRIDDFVAQAFRPLLEKTAQPRPRQTLIHGDFDLHNILYDAETNHVTGLLDFSFSHVASAAEEYYYSFVSLHHFVEASAPGNVLRKCLLEGFDAAPKTGKSESVDWPLANMVDAAFKAAGVRRPMDLAPAIDIVTDLYWFTQSISPAMFFMPRVRANMSAESLASVKKNEQMTVENVLDRFGF